MKNKSIKKIMLAAFFPLVLIVVSIISITVAGLLVRVFLSGLLWVVSGEFDFTWSDALLGIKVGSVAGGMFGIAIVLFRIFKVKGF